MTAKSPSTSTNGTASSSASSLFNLDEDDKTNILVYKYRSGCKSLSVTSQHDLCKDLDSSKLPAAALPLHIANRGRPPEPGELPYLRVTKKKIPRGNSRLEVRTEDLLPAEDLKKFGEKPSFKSSVANVGLPSIAYWKRLLFNSFPELYIVSRSVSPSNSANNSPESSQHVSPATTFPVDTSHPLQDPQATS